MLTSSDRPSMSPAAPVAAENREPRRGTEAGSGRRRQRRPTRANTPGNPAAARFEGLTVEERLEVLRRRLYRAHPTEEDLRRYEELRGALTRRPAAQTMLIAPSTAVPAPPVPAALPALAVPRVPMRPRRVPVAVAVAACVIGLAAATGGFLAGAGADAGADQPRPGSAAQTQHRTQDLGAKVVVDIGNGETLTARRNTVPEPVTTRTSIDGYAATAERFHGLGNEVVPLALPTASFDGGRVRIGLSATHASPMVWRILRLATRVNLTSYRQIIARGVVVGAAGEVGPTTFSYRGLPPMWVVVAASSDQRWTLIVALTERGGPNG